MASDRFASLWGGVVGACSSSPTLRLICSYTLLTNERYTLFWKIKTGRTKTNTICWQGHVTRQLETKGKNQNIGSRNHGLIALKGRIGMGQRWNIDLRPLSPLFFVHCKDRAGYLIFISWFLLVWLSYS